LALKIYKAVNWAAKNSHVVSSFIQQFDYLSTSTTPKNKNITLLFSTILDQPKNHDTKASFFQAATRTVFVTIRASWVAKSKGH